VKVGTIGFRSFKQQRLLEDESEAVKLCDFLYPFLFDL
jgi:hypothetical protein